jgi:tetratricopeptide (TPR) repeat protein
MVWTMGYTSRLYHAQGDYANALHNFEKALNEDPQNAQTYNNLGLIYEELRDWEKAISSFQRSVELDMFFPEGHLNLVRALYHHHSGNLSVSILHGLIERLYMTLSLDLDSKTVQPIREKVESFLDFLTASL